jgi:hypothetical protein
MNKVSPEVQHTIEQIQALAAKREDYIRNKGQSLSLKHLCNKFGIYPTLVKQFAPDLYENWDDASFHWRERS